MPLPTFTGLGPQPEFGDLVRKINTLVSELQNLLLNLDSLNVISITANSTTIRADLNTGAYIQLDGNGMTVFDGTKTTFQVSISGQVTMTAATIQSATGYPKVTIEPTNNLIAAYQSATNYARVEPNFVGSPAFVLSDGSINAYLSIISFFGSSLGLTSDGPIFLIPGSGDDLVVPSWSQLFSNGDGQDLQTALNSLSSSISSVSSSLSSLSSVVAGKADAFSGYTGDFVVKLDDDTPLALSFSNGILTSVG